jgi:hypothetical protein
MKLHILAKFIKEKNNYFDVFIHLEWHRQIS